MEQKAAVCASAGPGLCKGAPPISRPQASLRRSPALRRGQVNGGCDGEGKLWSQTVQAESPLCQPQPWARNLATLGLSFSTLQQR